MLATKDINAVMKKIEEREGLVKLMCEIELIIDRKDALLDTMKEFDKTFRNALKNGEILEDKAVLNISDPNEAKKKEAYSQFRHHGSWLQSNLHLTNLSLESALTQLQIIYGKGYTGFSTTAHTLKSQKKEIKTGDNDRTPAITANGEKDSESSDLHNDIDILAFDIGDEIAAKAIDPGPKSEVATMATNDYVQGMTASAGSLLMTTELLMELIQSGKEIKSDVIDMTLKSSLDQLKPIPLKNLPPEADVILRSREDAYNFLVETVNILLSELKAI